MKTIIIDNYDSFTYNLVHLIKAQTTSEVIVMRNDEIDHEAFTNCTHLILSPGPGTPDEAGELKSIISTYASKIKTLGVCLGHQAIAEVFGGSILNMDTVYHGVAETIDIKPSAMHTNLPESIEVGKYHSWIVDQLPADFKTTGIDKQGNIMSLEHIQLPIYGVQYHPESILTPLGAQLITNFYKHA